MQVKEITNTNEAIKKWRQCFGRHESENALVFSLLDRLSGNLNLFGKEKPVIFFSDNENSHDMALRTPPGNLILSYPECETSFLNRLFLFIHLKPLMRRNKKVLRG